jgi:hypothetical protein
MKSQAASIKAGTAGTISLPMLCGTGPDHNSSCDAPCPDCASVCLVPGSDPPDPTPEQVSGALFQPTSVCEMTGDARIATLQAT